MFRKVAKTVSWNHEKMMKWLHAIIWKLLLSLLLMSLFLFSSSAFVRRFTFHAHVCQLLASLSAESSLDKLPTSFVKGHEMTIWDIVLVSTQEQLLLPQLHYHTLPPFVCIDSLLADVTSRLTAFSLLSLPLETQPRMRKWLFYSVLLWNNHLPIRYRHRQSGSTAYRLQARPAPTGPGLQLTAMPRPNLPFNGLHLRNPCKLHVPWFLSKVGAIWITHLFTY